MKKIWKVVGILGALGVVAAIIVAMYVFRKAIDSVSKQKAEISIQADSLTASFESNETAANAKFLDKIIEVTGEITEITKDTSGYIVVLRNSSATSGVSCGLGKDQSEKAEKLKVGQKLSVKGICTGSMDDLMTSGVNVMLNKGAVIGE